MGKRTEKPERLDHEFVRDVEAPEKGAVTYWDSDPKVVGFGLRVYAGGGRSFFLNYRIDGRERRHTIGSFPRWSVAAARERAKELRKQIDKGHDPAGQKRERREAPTVQDLIDRYIDEHLPRKAAGARRGRKEDAGGDWQATRQAYQGGGRARRRHPRHAPQDQRVDRPIRSSHGARQSHLMVT